MAYIGSTPESQNFTSGTDYFNGTGSQTVFTLTRSVNSVNDVEAVVNNVIQQPNSYTVSGTTLTFSVAPSSGTSNVYVRYLSTTTQTIAPSQGTVGTLAIQNQAVTPTQLSQPLTRGTAVSASGTSVDFTGIPSWVKRITVMFNGVSTSTGSFVVVRIGTSGGIETTGYVSSSGTTSQGNTGFVDSSTSSFITRNGGTVTGGLSMVIVNISGNLWVQTHSGSSTSASVVTGGGNKTLSATLDRLRITTVNGTDTFTAGTINILYE